jgi:choline dehydrogenase-like flavoprotein
VTAADNVWDCVVVGSGAGGGTVAARLAEQGQRVFVIEAGGDPIAQGGDRLPDDVEVPAFHAFASENPAMSWPFEVRHYSEESRQARDDKYLPGRGVFYPRASALGGCTAHNAMIFMRAHDADWDHLAEISGDPSWRAKAMRRHLRRLEDCRHQPLWRVLRRFGIDPGGHGWDGWLKTERAMPLDALDDPEMRRAIELSTWAYLGTRGHPLRAAWHWLRGRGDPNLAGAGSPFTGLCYTPLTTDRHRRVGTRERLLAVREHHRDRLHIELDALATRVLFDAEGRACGVEYRKGARLYRADAGPPRATGERREVRARREVILAGGAFNTPQLLMLSGIGSAVGLRAHGIPVRVDLPGVGRNLQDRYEIGITHRVAKPWRVLQGARFERGDPQWRHWAQAGSGLYGSNGAALAAISRSKTAAGPLPDIFCMLMPSWFKGYYPGYSTLVRDHPDRMTWAILKAHTRNRAGRVTLRSADPLEAPQIDFHYFDAADDPQGADLAALVDAIGFVRHLTRPLRAQGLIAEELAPGPGVDSPAALADYVRDTAWGHHASCSCPIGAAADGGVLDARLRVHGLRGLRVADASVFPRIPGFFIAAAVYLVGEKAADMVLHDAARAAP